MVAHRRLTILGFLGAGLFGACSASDKFANDSGLDDGSPSPGSGAAPGAGGTAPTMTQTPPPETETDDSYTAPVVSGHWIWSANPLSGKVALIDASSFRVTTADAGLAPTYVAALGTSDDATSSAIVLNVGDDTASVLHAVSGDIGVQSVKVHPGANRMTVSQSGRWAIVWSDATLLANPDPTEGLQDVTVLDLGVSPAVSYPLTVGYRPSRVSLGGDETHAYFVTEPGISVVDLPATDPPTVARDVTVTANPQDATSVRDVTVTPDGSAAVVRHEGSAVVDVISLADGKDVAVTLPGAVTDLDLAPNGKVAFAVVRSTTSAGGSGGTGDAGRSGAGGTSGGVNAGGTGGGAGTSTTSGAGGTSGISGAGTSGGISAAGTSGGANTGGDGNQAGAAEGGMSGATELGVAGQADAGAASGGAPNEAGAPGASGNDTGSAGAPIESTGGSAGSGSGTLATPSYVAALDLAQVLRNPEVFEQLAIDDQVGSIVVAPEGDVALLYTNATPSDHVVILDTKSFRVVRTVLVKAPVKAVIPSPDGLHAVAALGQAAGSQKPGGFSLIPLTTSLAPKIVGTDAPPQAIAVGRSQALVTVDGKDPVKNLPVHAVYLAQLPAFGTTEVTLASPPLSAGLLDASVNLGFVAQSHPEGRITFLDLVTGQPRTLTGFELAARVVQGD